MRMPTTGQEHFARAPQVGIPRSVFSWISGHKTTFDAGYLIPILVEEILPGDSFAVRGSGFARLNTPLVPLMDNLYLETFFFFVPNRLVWTNWERFCGAQDDPTDSTSYLIPRCVVSDAEVTPMSVFDYMGIPPTPGGIGINALPLRGMNLIWNTWFRDQNLQDSVTVPLGDSDDSPATYEVLRRCKRPDYFTSCLPWAQKATNPVQLPLGTEAPVRGIGKDNQVFPDINASVFEIDGAVVYPDASRIDVVDEDGQVYVRGSAAAGGLPQVYADLTDATAATINQLRQAFAIQRMLERDARGGTRYIEIVRAHFGVTSDDARMQRPEYLGGGMTPVLISPVAQTSSTDATTPQANLAAIGTVSWRGHGFARSFLEHGFVLGFAMVRADLSYQQGLHRMWQKRSKYDIYWPEQANLGEQAVLNREIMATGTLVTDETVFGYQERGAEYRYHPSLITGLMRSGVAGSIDIWHVAQEFSAVPELGPDFIAEDPPIDRVVATPDEPHFKLDLAFQVRAARPMPVYGIPGLTRL